MRRLQGSRTLRIAMPCSLLTPASTTRSTALSSGGEVRELVLLTLAPDRRGCDFVEVVRGGLDVAATRVANSRRILSGISPATVVLDGRREGIAAVASVVSRPLRAPAR